MSSPISPDQLEWYDKAVYIAGQIAIVSGIAFGFMSLSALAQTIHRRYQKGKWLEQEAKGDADE